MFRQIPYLDGKLTILEEHQKITRVYVFDKNYRPLAQLSVEMAISNPGKDRFICKDRSQDSELIHNLVQHGILRITSKKVQVIGDSLPVYEIIGC